MGELGELGDLGDLGVCGGVGWGISVCWIKSVASTVGLQSYEVGLKAECERGCFRS